MNTNYSGAKRPVPWHIVQNVKTGFYHVVRHESGASEDEMEFLSTPSGHPRRFATGEAAQVALTKAEAA